MGCSRQWSKVTSFRSYTSELERPFLHFMQLGRATDEQVTTHPRPWAILLLDEQETKAEDCTSSFLQAEPESFESTDGKSSQGRHHCASDVHGSPNPKEENGFG